MDNSVLANIISFIGALLLLIGIKFRKEDVNYGLFNFTGASFMVVSACLLFNIGFIILNAVWAGIGLYLFVKNRKKQ